MRILKTTAVLVGVNSGYISHLDTDPLQPGSETMLTRMTEDRELFNIDCTDRAVRTLGRVNR